MNVHLGPAFQAIVFAAAGNDDSLRAQFENCFNEHVFDPSSKSAEWPKSSICSGLGGKASENGQAGSGELNLEVPKMDLISELPGDCISRMVSLMRLRGKYTMRGLLTRIMKTGIQRWKDCMEGSQSGNGRGRQYHEALQWFA